MAGHKWRGRSWRRRVIVSVLVATAWLGWLWFRLARSSDGHIPARIVGASIGLGHRLAAGLAPALGAAGARPTGPPEFPQPARSEEVGVVIVGGGIAGLTAAWRLLKSGWSDFVLLELESIVGGNAKAATMDVGGGQTVAHPWAAHYVPLPSAENVLLRELLAEAGAVRAGAPASGRGATLGQLAWDPSLLCPLPVERLFAPEPAPADGSRARAGAGRWLECPEGLLPSHLLTEEDRRQLGLLRKAVSEEAAAPSADGSPLGRRFAVPVAHSIVDARARALDSISALAWLSSVGVVSERVLWWAEYGLRDDYGIDLSSASAWALVHYFAARDSDERLEGADGNGWLVRHLQRAVGARARTRALVFDVRARAEEGGAARASTAPGAVSVRYWDEGAREVVELRARRVVYAAPRFTAKHTVSGYAPGWLANLTYAPWVVANVGLRRPPPAQQAPWLLAGWLGGGGAEGRTAWGYRACDSVIYNGPGGAPAGEAGGGLGYALTTSSTAREASGTLRALARLLWPPAWPERSAAVLTHFTALTALPPAEARKWLLGTTAAYWRERVLAELEVAHPNIRQLATGVDIAFLAHAMVRPTVGFIWGEARRLAAAPHASVVHWAHSDMAGLSLIEEAVHWGARAAEAVLLELTGTTATPFRAHDAEASIFDAA